MGCYMDGSQLVTAKKVAEVSKIPAEDPRRAALEIAQFSLAMSNEALANAHKGHWKDNDADVAHHVKELLYHAAKLMTAAEVGDKAAVLEYAADVANHAMFAADIAGALDAELTLTPAEGLESDDSKVPWGKHLPTLKERVFNHFTAHFVEWVKDAKGDPSDSSSNKAERPVD